MLFLLTQTDTASIFFKGKYLRYLADENKVIVVDSAYVKKGNIQLHADTIVYLIDRRKVLSKGRFLLIIDTSKIEGEDLIYNVDSQFGTAKHTRNFVQKGWLYSSRMYKLKADTLFVENGYFTTCELDTPHYAFYGTHILAINNDMAFVRNVVLKIRDIPVAYVPFWMFPLKRFRSSGFLTPSFGFNNIDGKYVRNLGFYWAMNNYMDLMLYMDIVERQGLRFGSKFNYALYRKFSGYVGMTFSNDFLVSGVRRRYSLEGSHKQSMWGYDMVASANFVSDKDYQQDYAENKDQWLKTTTSFSVQLAKNFSFANLSVLADYTKNLITEEYSSNMPSVSISFAPLSLAGISVSQSLSYRNFLHTQGKTSSTSHNLGFSANLNLPYDFNLPQSLSFQTSMVDTSLEVLLSYSTSIARTIYGRSIFSFWKLERFYHDITPSVGISYSKVILAYRKEYPPAYAFAYTYSVANQFSMKFSGKRISLASLNLSGSYNPQLDRPFSPLAISLSFPSFLGLSANFSTSYDYYTSEFAPINGNLSFHVSLGEFSISASASFPAKSGTFSVSGRLTRNWQITYSANMDLNYMDVLGQNLTLRRSLHRWEAHFTWSSVGIFSSYDFRIYLKDIPEIKITKGLMNIFLPEI